MILHNVRAQAMYRPGMCVRVHKDLIHLLMHVVVMSTYGSSYSLVVVLDRPLRRRASIIIIALGIIDISHS
jgi:hypothetical protein